MIDVQAVPPYIYDEIRGNSLSQGDILKVDGQFRNKFKEFYPAIPHPDGEVKYVLVLTQSCDLVRNGKRKPKLPHINVCLVRTVKAVIKRIIDDEIQPDSVGDIKLLPRDAMDQLKDRISKLINNNDQKMHFFLPQKPPFKEDMIALLHMSFSFRTEEHYDMFLENRIFSFKPEFQAKLGHIISQLYGRIATTDLSDLNWKDKQSRQYINDLLVKIKLRQVPDIDFIEYIKKNANTEQDNIEELIEKFQFSIIQKKSEPFKRELLKSIRSRLIAVFGDSKRVRALEKMGKQELSKEIMKIINPIE